MFCHGIITSIHIRCSRFNGRENNIIHNLDRIIDVTCTERDRGKVSVLGFNGPGLGLGQLQYHAAKKRLQEQTRCTYTYLSFVISPAEKDRYDPDALFDVVTAMKPAYYFSLNEDIVEQFISKRKKRQANKVRTQMHRADLALQKKIALSEKFQLTPLLGYNDLRIYRYDDTKEGTYEH